MQAYTSSQKRCLLLALLFCVLFVSTNFANKYVLSVLKFTYPTIFQGLHQALHQYVSYPHLHCLVGMAAEGIVKFQPFEACDPPLTFLEPILQTPSDIPKCHGLSHELYSLEFRVSKQFRVSSSSCHI
ncbi:transmembrane protein 241 [Plakobranchus ocellatus]|uniref:Transmembrane protein 241 n=1 Tax=Plakobranchus ocellatus TaxID=259542 RepID=A0AAV4BTY5_9GAST|nr:transmembrane protein 241 [Plakobranchus ocellatus]